MEIVVTKGKPSDNPPVEVQLFSQDAQQPTAVTHRQRVRLRIIAVALRLFGSRSYKSVTVADIADRAGMSERTFFRYFDSKESVLFFWMDWQRQVMVESLASEHAEEWPLIALRRCFIHLAALNEKHQDKARILVKLIMSTPELRSRYYGDHLKWEDLLVETMMANHPLNEVQRFQLRVQVNTAIGLYVSVIRPWAFEEMSAMGLPKLVAQAFDAISVRVFAES